MTNEELLDKYSLSIRRHALGEGNAEEVKELDAEILRRLTASQPEGNNPQICPKCGRKADGYISATSTRKGGHYVLLCDYSPSHPSGSSAPSPQRSSTFGDLPTAVREAEMIEPHEWDNMNISDQREWALDQLASRVAPSGSAGPELKLMISRDGIVHAWCPDCRGDCCSPYKPPDPPAEPSVEAKGETL